MDQADDFDVRVVEAAPVELPPSIVASKTYRGKDNSLVQIDWLSENKGAYVHGDKQTQTHVKPAEAVEGQPASTDLTAEGGYVLKGKWRYLEHDWVATEGAYVYEAPGETHTLVVDPDVEEMITMFQVNGAMIYVDPDGKCLGYDDVFTRIDKCRAHYAQNGLGAEYVDQFIR